MAPLSNDEYFTDVWAFLLEDTSMSETIDNHISHKDAYSRSSRPSVLGGTWITWKGRTDDRS